MGLKAVFLGYLVTYNALHPHPFALVPLAYSAEAAPPHSCTFHSLSPPSFLSNSFDIINRILNAHNPSGTKHEVAFLSPTLFC